VRTHTILHPSNAGIGRILKIARANEIIPANARYKVHHHVVRISPHIFTIHTGHESQFTDSHIFSPFSDAKLDPSLHNEEKVRSTCATISLRAAQNPLSHLN
jgi:hypothetical protein